MSAEEAANAISDGINCLVALRAGADPSRLEAVTRIGEMLSALDEIATAPNLWASFTADAPPHQAVRELLGALARGQERSADIPGLCEPIIGFFLRGSEATR